MEDVKDSFVKQLNEEVTITLRRHEIVRLGQIVHAQLSATPTKDYAYERAIYEKLTKAANE